MMTALEFVKDPVTK